MNSLDPVGDIQSAPAYLYSSSSSSGIISQCVSILRRNKSSRLLNPFASTGCSSSSTDGIVALLKFPRNNETESGQGLVTVLPRFTTLLFFCEPHLTKDSAETNMTTLKSVLRIASRKLCRSINQRSVKLPRNPESQNQLRSIARSARSAPRESSLIQPSATRKNRSLSTTPESALARIPESASFQARSAWNAKRESSLPQLAKEHGNLLPSGKPLVLIDQSQVTINQNPLFRIPSPYISVLVKIEYT